MSACPVHAPQCQDSARAHRTYAVFAEPTHVEPGAPSVARVFFAAGFSNILSCRVECVWHKLRARSLRLGWHHGVK